MGNTLYYYDKNSNPPKTAWNDDGRINIMAFENIDKFHSFLDGLGISKTLWNTSGIGGWAGVFSSYAKLAGYITLTIMVNKYSIGHSFGVKKGHNGNIVIPPSSYYLTIFNNLSWTPYYHEMSTSGGTHGIYIDHNLNVSVS